MVETSGAPSTQRRATTRRLAVLVFLLVLVVLVLPTFWPDRYDQVELSRSLQPPGWRHPFGTDLLGRDMFVRVLTGARISLVVAVASRLVALVLGIALGGCAARAGGWVDFLVMRVVDTMLAFPALLLALALVTIWGPNIVTLAIAIGLASWAEIARLARAQVLRVQNREFVQAARALGCGPLRCFLHHILPNCLNPLLVWTTTGMAGAILAESGLAFLGMGVAPPLPSWGALVAQGWELVLHAPWLTFFPGAALALTVILLNLLGDRLRQSCDSY